MASMRSLLHSHTQHNAQQEGGQLVNATAQGHSRRCEAQPCHAQTSLIVSTHSAMQNKKLTSLCMPKLKETAETTRHAHTASALLHTSQCTTRTSPACACQCQERWQTQRRTALPCTHISYYLNTQRNARQGPHQLVYANAQGDSRGNEAQRGHPQICQYAVQQPPRPLQGGLEGDACSKLACQGAPGTLDIGEPQDHVGDVGKPQCLRMPPLQRTSALCHQQVVTSLRVRMSSMQKPVAFWCWSM